MWHTYVAWLVVWERFKYTTLNTLNVFKICVKQTGYSPFLWHNGKLLNIPTRGLYRNSNLLISTTATTQQSLEQTKNIPKTRQAMSSRINGIPLTSNMFALVCLRVESCGCCASSPITRTSGMLLLGTSLLPVSDCQSRKPQHQTLRGSTKRRRPCEKRRKRHQEEKCVLMLLSL